MIPEKARDTLLSALKKRWRSPDLSVSAFDRNYTILASGAKLHDTLLKTIELK
jgi:hypothetical protein